MGKGVSRGLLDATFDGLAEKRRQRGGARGGEGGIDVGDDDFPCGEEGGIAKDFKTVAERRGAGGIEVEVDFQQIVEARRGEVIATGVDAGPGVAMVEERNSGFLLQFAGEGVFGDFGEAEEIREMDDAGHVRFMKADAVPMDERGAGHGWQHG